MNILGFSPLGYEGVTVFVEVDIRTGIPGTEIVGLPDGAVRESRERVRIAVRNSGFRYPSDRVLINLAPADVRKEGASFDLSIALAILAFSGQIQPMPEADLVVLGELLLSGSVRPVKGVLAAVAGGLSRGVNSFLVPKDNLEEALALGAGKVYGISSLNEAVAAVKALGHGMGPYLDYPPSAAEKVLEEEEGDLSDIKGQEYAKRGLEVAAAGMHNLLLFGPPGSGKTLMARRFATILPDLAKDESLAVTRIFSLAGMLSPGEGIITRPRLRSPHHSSSAEGIIGGGKIPRPGEVSLAHFGVLLLDEAPEFGKPILQALREPLERSRVDLARAEASSWFPADFQLILTANPCPCGNLGKEDGACLCSREEILRYWRKLGWALLDRIDIRIPIRPVRAEEILGSPPEGSAPARERVRTALKIQRERYSGYSFSRNSRIPPGYINRFCPLSGPEREVFLKALSALSLSSRASHSVLKVARTIADLEGSADILRVHLLEALQHRRYGDGDFFWDAA